MPSWWPWVSRRDVDHLELILKSQGEHLAYQLKQYDALLVKYHELRQAGFAAPGGQVTVPDAHLPPAILLRAMKEVSPVPDRAYEMNYQYAMGLEPLWGDETAMRQAASVIRRGVADVLEDEEVGV